MKSKRIFKPENQHMSLELLDIWVYFFSRCTLICVLISGFMEDDTMYIDIVVDNSHTSLADLPNIPINAEAEPCTQPPQ